MLLLVIFIISQPIFASAKHNTSSHLSSPLFQISPEESIVNDDDDDDDDDGREQESYGLVESFPSDLVGDWVINGTTYIADASTQFEQDHGPFSIGICVEVEYTISNSMKIASKIETKEPQECQGADDDNEQDDEANHLKGYGILNSFPDNLIGEWVINGVTYVADAVTEFEQEHGIFAVNTCVEIQYIINGVNQASVIETTEMYHCTGDVATNEVYGLIESLPTGLYGSWVVAGQPYEVTPNTQLEQEAGAFAVGICVKIEYYTQNGVNQVTEIETESNQDCTGGGIPATANIQKIYATITVFPPALVGPWVIGRVSYTATATTEFEQAHGNFADGRCVEAKFDTSKTLLEVETEQAYKCQANGVEQFTIYGVVTMMPVSPTLTGTWEIGGIAYETDANPQFEQAYGFFALGAYVEVKYILQGNTRLAVSIETHVAPGNGLQNGTGRLTSFDATDDWQAWVINGLTYQADPVIEVGSGNQAPQLGQVVVFNSYQRNNVNYLTSVVGATQVFLPLVIR